MRLSQLPVILSLLVSSALTFTAVHGYPAAGSVMSVASITIMAMPISVRAGDRVTFTGRTKGMPIGSKLVLQHKKGSKWTTLQASTTVKQGSSYSLDAKLNDKGKQELRITHDEVTSPTVAVTVQ
ncbi:hypothetical protein KI688_004234 [Linnemannia hyalina]|uniref:Bacterial Ig domain-containing protein n=1 Tax=Linnemannia hyalina TaxID=64524 RepID=A0A9P7XML4_9FUNG|nr:hypothetical protein KI688_004234 [Linnemannia hyalina]